MKNEKGMLNINPETVCHIIEKAREFQAKEQVVIPDVLDIPADDWPLKAAADNLAESTGAYLLAHPLVASYLMDGLVQHGYRCEE